MRLNPLPLWKMGESSPAFYDSESVTAIEAIAKLYGKTNEIVEDYNKFVEMWNKQISEFEYSTTKELSLFEKSMRQEFQDFIDVVSVKYELLESSVDEKINEIELPKIEIDEELNTESENPVQNKIVASEIKGMKSSLETLDNKLKYTFSGRLFIDDNEYLPQYPSALNIDFEVSQYGCAMIELTIHCEVDGVHNAGYYILEFYHRNEGECIPVIASSSLPITPSNISENQFNIYCMIDSYGVGSSPLVDVNIKVLSGSISNLNVRFSQ